MKQTKIIATVGPASTDINIISQLIKEGVNVFRINFSHGTRQTQEKSIQDIRQVAKELKQSIAIMGDLQGPKIRVAKFIHGKVELTTGQEFILDCNYNELGNQEIVGVDYKELARDVKINDTLLLDDGNISLQVINTENDKVFCIVSQGGTLKDNKGINKLGGGLTAPALTTKDFTDIEFAAKINLDYIAISFVRDQTDIALARSLLSTYKSKASIVAKIERTEAITNMEQIVINVDAIMVARGDLAVEIGEAHVPAIQKTLIKLARRHHKLSIVATQMLESMIKNPVATRAEISDIANAVLDGTDAVMLSAETASGSYPVASVITMTRACIAAEKNPEVTFQLNMKKEKFNYIDQAVAMSTLYSAYHLQAKSIIALTTSGATALWLSRVNIGIPIYAMTNSLSAARQMALYKDVHPILLKKEEKTTEELYIQVKEILDETNIVKKGDIVLITMGDILHKIGGTNTMKIVKW